MADKQPPEEEKHPATLTELEQELDKDALSPEVTAVESQPDDLPSPREKSASGTASLQQAEEPGISDEDLREAGAAADQTDDQAEDTAPLPNDESLHLESDPEAPRPPFWKRKKFWISAIIILLLAAAFAWFIRPSRLAMVNALGLRANLSITTETQAKDGQKSALLKNVTMLINGQEHQTNEEGKLDAKVPYGTVTITTTKPGYEEVENTLLADFDPFFYFLGGRQQDEDTRTITLQLKAVGLPLSFQTKDWLTEGPITAGTFTVGDIVARPDEQGLVHFALPPTDATTAEVYAAFDGSYLNKTFELPLDGSQQEVTFVPAGKNYFMSTRSGTPAVYSSDIDGSKVTEVVPPSPNETAAMNIAVNPGGTHGVLASTRAPIRDSQGTLLQQLYIVDFSDNKLTPIDKGIWFRFIDWAGDTFVYVAAEHTPTGVTQRLASLNVTTGKQTNLGTATAYGAVRVAINNIVYQVEFSPDDDNYANNPQLRTVSLSGGTETQLGNTATQLAQPANDRFVFRTADGLWHEYNVNTSQSKSASAPAQPGRAFLATSGADGQYRLLVDRADGIWTLVAKQVATGEETTLHSVAGIQGPVRFAGNTVVFRMAQPGGATADYAVALSGGEPKKITDVTQPLEAFAPLAGYFSFF